MKNAIITININKYLNDVSRNSMLFISDKWNCDYIEIKTLKNNKIHPGYEKFNVIESFINYDRILYIDADTVISTITPNPFELYKTETFITVNDIHTRFLYNTEKFINCINDFIIPSKNYVEKTYNITTDQNFIKTFFNSGFMMYSPKIIAPLLKNINTLIPQNESHPFAFKPHYEQFLLNLLINFYYNEHHINISDDWNYIPINENDIQNKKYIYHLTGNRKHLINKINWKLC